MSVYYKLSHELDRLRFIADRDGPGAAFEFAQRALPIYQSVLNPINKHPLAKFAKSNRTARESFEQSVEAFERFLNGELMV